MTEPWGGDKKRYGVGVDHPERDVAWQTDDLATAKLTAAIESLGGTAVVCEFETSGSVEVLHIYRDGKPSTSRRETA